MFYSPFEFDVAIIEPLQRELLGLRLVKCTLHQAWHDVVAQIKAPSYDGDNFCHTWFVAGVAPLVLSEEGQATITVVSVTLACVKELPHGNKLYGRRVTVPMSPAGEEPSFDLALFRLQHAKAAERATIVNLRGSGAAGGQCGLSQKLFESFCSTVKSSLTTEPETGVLDFSVFEADAAPSRQMRSRQKQSRVLESSVAEKPDKRQKCSTPCSAREACVAPDDQETLFCDSGVHKNFYHVDCCPDSAQTIGGRLMCGVGRTCLRAIDSAEADLAAPRGQVPKPSLGRRRTVVRSAVITDERTGSDFSPLISAISEAVSVSSAALTQTLSKAISSQQDESRRMQDESRQRESDAQQIESARRDDERRREKEAEQRAADAHWRDMNQSTQTQRREAEALQREANMRQDHKDFVERTSVSEQGRKLVDNSHVMNVLQASLQSRVPPSGMPSHAAPPGFLFHHMANTGGQMSETPMTYGQVPMPYGQMPMTYGQMPMTYGQMPMAYGQMPMTYGQMPMTYAQTPMPYAQMPMPYDQVQMQYAQMQMPYTPIPIPHGQAPPWAGHVTSAPPMPFPTHTAATGQPASVN